MVHYNMMVFALYLSQLPASTEISLYIEILAMEIPAVEHTPTQNVYDKIATK